MKIYLTHADVAKLAQTLVAALQEEYGEVELKVYAVPRGGVPAAYMLAAVGLNMRLVAAPEFADIIVDDLIDSGKTMDRYGRYMKPFHCLIDKRSNGRDTDAWVVFPWEHSDILKDGKIEHGRDDSFSDNITRLLQFIGEDVKRGGLMETPNRVIKAWEEWTSGYSRDPKAALKVFKDGGEAYDQVVLVRDIPFYSHCEHHLAPFFGVAHVGYIPDGNIVGLSKLPELVDIFAKRLQVQERLTNQVADALWENLKPKGVGVVMSARHMCMESRGKKCRGSSTVTSALRGTMLTEADCRAEFLNLIKL